MVAGVVFIFQVAKSCFFKEGKKIKWMPQIKPAYDDFK